MPVTHSPAGLNGPVPETLLNYTPVITTALYFLASLVPVALPSKQTRRLFFSINSKRHWRLLTVAWMVSALFVSL